MFSRLTLSALLFLTPLSLSQAAEEFDSDAFYREIWSYYGPKHSAMYPSREGIEQIPDELWEKIVKSWYGIDGAPMAYKPHWHAEDRHDQTFESFITRNYFVPVDKIFESPEVVCKQHDGWSELLLYSNKKKWLDFNIIAETTYDSVTLWEWYNTVALKSGDVEIIAHGTPTTARWNWNSGWSDNPNQLNEFYEALRRTGQFEIYVEPNPYRVSGMMMTQEDKREYQIFPHLNLYGLINIPPDSETSDCLYK